MLLGIKKLITGFRRDERGQFSVIIALFGLPLLMMCGYAVDLNKAVSEKGNLSAALDAAALASVIPANLTVAEREAFAREMFAGNYFGESPVTLIIEASRERVHITGETTIDTMLGGAIGMGTLEIRETAEAVLTRSDIICVLALDPSGERAIEFLDDARFNSPACSVQANSTHHMAMNSYVTSPPLAKSFCVGGISQGEYLPYVKHACSPVKDPYANLMPPEDGPCMDIKKIKGMKKSNGKKNDDDDDDDDDDDNEGGGEGNTSEEDVVEDNVVLVPGTYCNGLDIKGVNITFPEGVYIVKGGRFRVRQNAQADGQNVLFVMKGKKSTLHIEGNSKLTLKAPANGKYAGLALWHVEEKKLGKIKRPGGKHLITSGGGLSITGAVYLPTDSLVINSDSPVVSQAPATSFIAYRLLFKGKANVQVHVDHEAGGIPSTMFPRSDDGARLVE